MKSERIERVVCIICLAVMFFFMCSIGLRVFTRLVLVKHFEMDNAFTRLVLFDNPRLQTEEEAPAIDWEALYPFPAQTQDIQITEEESSAEKFSNIVFNIEGKIEDFATYYLIGYHELAEMAKSYENFLQWNISPYENGVIQLNDGYLTFISKNGDVTNLASSITAFADFCQGRGIDFLYVQAPNKVCKDLDPYIANTLDFSNQNADNLLALLRENNIETYDFRETIHSENLSHHELFYRTDHHWKAETGLWAAQHILTYLHDEYGYDIDASVLEASRFTSVEYPNWFLGSNGRRVTLAKTTPDNFSLLYPSYQTELHYEVPERSIDVTGDFSVTYDMSHVDELDYYNKDPYSAYSSGCQALQKLENRLLANETKLLIIGDSFDNCMIPFLSLGIQYVDSLDLRYFTGSVQNYIETTKPDIVLVLYNAEIISPKRLEDLFDFR